MIRVSFGGASMVMSQSIPYIHIHMCIFIVSVPIPVVHLDNIGSIYIHIYSDCPVHSL